MNSRSIFGSHGEHQHFLSRGGGSSSGPRAADQQRWRPYVRPVPLQQERAGWPVRPHVLLHYYQRVTPDGVTKKHRHVYHINSDRRHDGHRRPALDATLRWPASSRLPRARGQPRRFRIADALGCPDPQPRLIMIFATCAAPSSGTASLAATTELKSGFELPPKGCPMSGLFTVKVRIIRLPATCAGLPGLIHALQNPPHLDGLPLPATAVGMPRSLSTPQWPSVTLHRPPVARTARLVEARRQRTRTGHGFSISPAFLSMRAR
jgi:hypothetical protein